MLNVPVQGEKTPLMTNEDILGAARRVAMVLANGGGAGYNYGWSTLLCCRVPADLVARDSSPYAGSTWATANDNLSLLTRPVSSALYCRVAPTCCMIFPKDGDLVRADVLGEHFVGVN